MLTSASKSIYCFPGVYKIKFKPCQIQNTKPILIKEVCLSLYTLELYMYFKMTNLVIKTSVVT